MTQEQKHAALDVLAALISFDCNGIDCYDCVFSDSNGTCMLTIARAKFDALNKSTDLGLRNYVKADELNEKGDN